VESLVEVQRRSRVDGDERYVGAVEVRERRRAELERLAVSLLISCGGQLLQHMGDDPDAALFF